jgi:hypothetical protein
MEEHEVKVEEAEDIKTNAVVKVEERTEPTLNNSPDLSIGQTMGSWNVIYA